MITFASVFGGREPEILSFLQDAWKLKDEIRTGWTIRGVPDPESVADHSWGTALLVALFADQAGVERSRALEIALVHDLAEARTGDIPTRVRGEDQQTTPERKRLQEYEAIDAMLAPFHDSPPSQWIRGRFSEYEERKTPEARFVADMNLIDMVLQALIYKRAGRYDRSSDALDPTQGDFPGLSEFFATAEPRIATDIGRRLFDQVSRAYEELVT
jgi:putative hydrolase of HD superfamily